MNDHLQEMKNSDEGCPSSCPSCASRNPRDKSDSNEPVFVGKSLVVASLLGFVFPIAIAGLSAWLARSFLPDTPAGQAGIAGVAIAGLVASGVIASKIIKRMSEQIVERNVSDNISS